MISSMTRPRFVRYGVTTILLVSFLAGCHRWTPIQLGPDLPDRVRVSYTSTSVIGACPEDRERVEFRSPFIVGDSLLGRTQAEPDTMAIATSNICLLEERRADPVRTALAVVTGTIGVLSLVFVIGFQISCANDPNQLLC